MHKRAGPLDPNPPKWPGPLDPWTPWGGQRATLRGQGAWTPGPLPSKMACHARPLGREEKIIDHWPGLTIHDKAHPPETVFGSFATLQAHGQQVVMRSADTPRENLRGCCIDLTPTPRAALLRKERAYAPVSSPRKPQMCCMAQVTRAIDRTHTWHGARLVPLDSLTTGVHGLFTRGDPSKRVCG